MSRVPKLKDRIDVILTTAISNLLHTQVVRLYHEEKTDYISAIGFYIPRCISHKITGNKTDIFTHFTDYTL